MSVWSIKCLSRSNRICPYLVIYPPANYDLKIFPDNTYVLGLNSSSLVCFVRRSEAVSKIERAITVRRPFLDILQVNSREHYIRTTALRRMRSQLLQQYMEVSPSF